MKSSFRLSRKEIEALMKRPNRLSSDLFTIYFVKSDFPKFAVSISSKIAKTAVLRNKIKRRLREATKKALSGHSFGKKAFFLIVPTKRAVDAPYKLLFKEFLAIYSKIPFS